MTETDLTEQNTQQLSFHVLAALSKFGGDTVYVDGDHNPRKARLARIGSDRGVVLIDLEADKDRSLPRRVDCFFVRDADPSTFRIHARRSLFSLWEKGFYKPPGFRFEPHVDPERWFNPLMIALTSVLGSANHASS